MRPETARQMWHATEPYHAVTYFASPPQEAFRAAGLRGFWMGYFAGRSAPLGPVPAEVVIATFFNFHPARVRRAIPDAWGFAGPQRVLEARLAGVDEALRGLLGERVGTRQLAEAADLARTAAEAGDPAGRPLFAGNASLPWPAEPHLVLWQATTMLREFRGDGHVAALLAEGLDGCEAHVLAAAAGAVPGGLLEMARGWSEDDRAAAADRLRSRSWLDGDGALTPSGQQARDRIEQRTDQLALPLWRHLGAERCDRLHSLLAEPVQAILAGDIIPFPNPIGLPRPSG